MSDESSPPTPGSRRHLYGERFGLVLLVLVGAYVVSGLGEEPIFGFLSATCFLGVLAASLLSPGIHHRLRVCGLVVTGVLLPAAIWATTTDPSDDALAVIAVLALTAQVCAFLAIMSRISKHAEVRTQTVLGGISAYVLIGFVFASLYRAIDLVTDNHFLVAPADTTDMIYFSFVTLTTVGYGDLSPATDLAQRLVVAEALIGQVFLVTLVARLVSLWGRDPGDA